VKILIIHLFRSLYVRSTSPPRTNAIQRVRDPRMVFWWFYWNAFERVKTTIFPRRPKSRHPDTNRDIKYFFHLFSVFLHKNKSFWRVIFSRIFTFHEYNHSKYWFDQKSTHPYILYNAVHVAHSAWKFEEEKIGIIVCRV
jgi:YD repeat-containing protein